MSSSFTDTYKRYKAGTSQVLTWLVEHAQQCQDVSSLFNIKTGDAMSTTVVTIQTKDILLLAQIVEQSGWIKVPALIIDTAKDIIAQRRECSAWYSHDHSAQKENAEHGHFIGVLEQVLRVLKNVAEPTLHIDSAPSSSSPEVDEMSNVFEELEVEEPAEWKVAPEVTQSELLNPPTSEVRYELKEKENDGDLQLYCFLKDCLETREFVHDSWQKYFDGDADLATVSFVTNAAIGLVQCAYERLVFAYPKFQGWASFIAFVRAKAEQQREGTREPDSKDESDGAVPNVPDCTETEDCADADNCTCGGEYPKMLCLRAYHLLRHHTFRICKNNEHKHNIVPNVPEPDQSTAAFELVFTFAQRLVKLDCMTICGEVFLLSLGDIAKQACCCCFDLPSLIINCEIFLDIYDMFEANRHKALQDLRQNALRMKEQVINHSASVRALGLDSGPVSTHINGLNEQGWMVYLLANFVGFIDIWVLADNFPGDDAKDKTWLELLLAHPALCGLLTDTLERRLYEYSLQICNVGFLVTPMAHLYNAARLSSNPELRWPDMDQTIEIQGAQRLYIGAAPTALKDVKARLSLAMGSSLATLGKDHVRRASEDDAKWPRPVRPLVLTSPISKTIDGFWHQRKLDWTCSNVARFAEHIADACLEYLPASSSDEALIEGTQLSRDLSTLYQARKEEGLQFQTNLLRLHSSCLQIARRVFDASPPCHGFPFQHPHIDLLIPAVIEALHRSRLEYFRSAVAILVSHVHDISAAAAAAALNDGGLGAAVRIETLPNWYAELKRARPELHPSAMGLHAKICMPGSFCDDPVFRGPRMEVVHRAVESQTEQTARKKTKRKAVMVGGRRR